MEKAMAITTDEVAAKHHLAISRVFSAPRELVFAAWSSAEHVKNWFCPESYSVPQASVDFRVGGTFDVCMRAPNGQEHWTRGKFVEIVPHSRLVIDMSVPGEGGNPLFLAHTVVNFSDEQGGTRLDVTQSFTLFEPIAEPMVKGAELGWSQTLDRLTRELEHMQQGASLARDVVHGSFRIERTYDAPRAQVFSAFADPVAKAKWFCRPGLALEHRMDVRPGGREHLKGRCSPDSAMVSTFDAVYFDVVPNERLVYTYEMHLGERKISVSLATIEFKQAGSGTTVVMSEHGAFLDGYEDGGSREHGTGLLLDAVGASLKA
jgi:uncharacterized protein YndB with AHSA1/START domain